MACIKILVISNALPHVSGATRGADIVLFEILKLLVSQRDMEVAYAQIGFDLMAPSPATHAGAAGLREFGVKMFAPIKMDREKPAGFLVRNFDRIIGRGLIPGAGQGQKIVAACHRAGWFPDVVLPVWSEDATAAASELAWPVFAYYGNPFHKVMAANLWLERRFEWRWSPEWLLRHAVSSALLRLVERQHLRSMKRLAVVADVHANDTAYYQSRGVKARYLHSMWPKVLPDDWERRRDETEVLRPLKIIASVGAVPSTGNTYGFVSLAADILPALKRSLGEGSFELHICGKGQPRAFLNRMLDDPAIKLRGFVDDLDAEILSAPVYLVACNGGAYKAGHNRILHAWSLGACIITWRDSALAQPELVHGENALLADNPDQMAIFVREAAQDRALRRRLGSAGGATLAAHYRSSNVVDEMAREIRQLIA
jgi:glycosyltransferase involved in cell wall biosynthesis